MYKNKKLFFIAEAGVNHENNLNLAEKIIKEAKMGGADAVKFQTYKAETIASKYSPAYWDTNEIKINSQFKLFKKYDHFNKNDYQKSKPIKRNIKFTMIPDLLASPTAELTLGLLIGLSRNLLIGDEYVRSEKFKGWEPKFFSNGIEGKNVCLLGMGKLGVEVARKIKGFNVKLFYHDLQKLDSIDEQQLNTKYLELNDLFEKADYLVILLPLKTNNTQ